MECEFGRFTHSLPLLLRPPRPQWPTDRFCTQPNPLPSFEVATIKPAQNTAQGFSRPPRNIFRLINVTARDLVRIAYGLPPGPATVRVLAGPGWIDTNHYNVEGKVPDELFAEMQKTPMQQQRNQMFLMGQSMLADRFKLKVHFEQREMPIYELVVAKGGPKLTPAKEPPLEPDTPPPLPANGGPPRARGYAPGNLTHRQAGQHGDDRQRTDPRCIIYTDAVPWTRREQVRS